MEIDDSLDFGQYIDYKITILKITITVQKWYSKIMAEERIISLVKAIANSKLKNTLKRITIKWCYLNASQIKSHFERYKIDAKIFI